MATGKIVIPGWKLLWTNPTPSVEFPAQTISIDLSNYDMIMVIPRAGTTNLTLSPVIVPKGDRGLITYVFLNENSGASNLISHRRIDSVNDNGVSFENAQLKAVASTSASSTYNTACIPYKIFAR